MMRPTQSDERLLQQWSNNGCVRADGFVNLSLVIKSSFTKLLGDKFLRSEFFDNKRKV